MQKISLLLLSLITFTGCPNVNELPERVNIKINFVGLEFQSEETDSLKSAATDVFSGFSHIYTQIELYMDTEGAYYNLRTGNIEQGISSSFAVGTYHVGGYGGYAFPSGSSELTFQIPDQEVVIGTGSTSVDLNVVPDCCLILVADFEDQLDAAYISVGSNPGNDFFRSGQFYYAYINPAPGNQVHIIKKSGAKLIINTSELSVGRTYKVEIISD